MPSGLMPTYAYRPSTPGTAPKLRARSSRRARLFLGGTYFRAREPGGAGNNISVQIIEYPDHTAQLIVTNHNTLYAENVTGPVSVNVLEQNLSWADEYVIDQLSATPHAKNYSISCQIGVAPVLVKDLGEFSFSQLLNVPGQLTAKLTLKPSEVTPTSQIIIKARTRVYDLVTISKTSTSSDPSTPAVTSSGYDPDALRTAVNANDPWIQMMPRSGTPTSSDPAVPAVPLAVKFDEQDDGVDDDFLSVFPDTNLGGGDGLPDSPNAERNGPTRSIVLVQYGEAPNGALNDVNEVYEWAGDTSTSGQWVKY